MGYRYSQIPTLNNIQFVPETFELPIRYHQRQIDKEWYYQNLRSWQTPRPYYQPIQQSDKQYLEVHIAGIEDVLGFDTHMYIIDCHGDRVTTNQSPDFQIFDSGSVYVTDDGQVIDMAVNKWNFRFADFTLDDGLYRVVVVCNFYDVPSVTPDPRLWISEPINLKADHPDTILVEAWNDTNKQDVIFQYEGLGFVGDEFYTPKFGYRFYGDIDYDNDTVRDATDFIEQDDETRQLSVEGNPIDKIYIGGNHGVAFYMRDKLNEALKCDNVYVEGRRKTVIEGGQWDIVKADNYRLYKGTIELTDYDRRDRFTDTAGAVIDLFEIPSYPFNVYIITLQLAGNITYGRIIYNDSDRDDYLDYLNNVIVDQRNQLGEYLIDDGYLKYRMGANESESLVYALINTEYFTLSVTTNAINQTFRIQFDNFLGGIDWGDSAQSNYSYSGGTISVSNGITHTYATAGTYTINVFHDDITLKKMALLGGAYTSKLVGQVTGNIPIQMREVTIRFNPDLGTAHAFAMLFLNRASLTLTTIDLSSNSLTTISDNVFVSKPYTITDHNWLQVQTYALTGNALSVSEVNSCISDFYVNTPKFLQGILGIKQTPPATPTGTALTQANDLASFFGWIVNRD